MIESTPRSQAPCRLLQVLTCLVVLLLGTYARAEGLALHLNWSALPGDAQRALASDLSKRAGPDLADTRAKVLTEATAARNPFAVRLSFIARDWSEGLSLTSGGLSLTDQLRALRSTRLMIARVRFGEGTLVPYVQLGAGQWRVDTNAAPLLPNEMELASQVGGGFDVKLLGQLSLATEATYTMLYRQSHEGSRVAIGSVFGALLASRLRF